MSEDKAVMALRTGLEVALELLAMKGEALGHDSERIQTYKDAVMELREALADLDLQIKRRHQPPAGPVGPLQRPSAKCNPRAFAGQGIGGQQSGPAQFHPAQHGR
jgi:hypothetical protein